MAVTRPNKAPISNSQTPAPAVLLNVNPASGQMAPMNMRGGSGSWGSMYSNSYFFCSKCVDMVPPPRAIQSFFCVQNVLDIFWSIGYGALALRPPGSDYPALIIFWIIFVLGVLQVVCMLLGMFISFCARSELNTLLREGKGSSNVTLTKVAILLYTIGLTITVGFFCIFWIFAIYFVLSLKSSSANVVTGLIGLVMLVFAVMLLPFALIYIS